MNMWRVGEDMGSKETDRCPLTPIHPPFIRLDQSKTSHYRNLRTMGRKDERGIDKDNWGRRRAPRERLQPDTNNPFQQLHQSEQKTYQTGR
jgi:hypothetical protein